MTSTSIKCTIIHGELVTRDQLVRLLEGTSTNNLVNRIIEKHNKMTKYWEDRVHVVLYGGVALFIEFIGGGFFPRLLKEETWHHTINSWYLRDLGGGHLPTIVREKILSRWFKCNYDRWVIIKVRFYRKCLSVHFCVTILEIDLYMGDSQLGMIQINLDRWLDCFVVWFG